MSRTQLLSPTILFVLFATQSLTGSNPAMAEHKGSASNSRSPRISSQLGSFSAQNLGASRIQNISGTIKTFHGGSGGGSGHSGGSGQSGGSGGSGNGQPGKPGPGSGGSSSHHWPSGGCFPKLPWPPSSHHCDHRPPVIITVPTPVPSSDPIVVVDSSSQPEVPRNQLPGGAAGIRQEIWIVNLPENRADVSYLMGGQSATTPAGQMQIFPANSAVITYDRGSQFGQASNTLTAGTYEFQITEQGWQIFRKTFDVKLANPGVVEEFRFLVDSKPMSLRAGQGMGFKGDFPIQVTFDQGKGGQPVTRPLMEGEYLLQIDPTQGVLDIAPAQAAQANSPMNSLPNQGAPMVPTNDLNSAPMNMSQNTMNGPGNVPLVVRRPVENVPANAIPGQQ